MGVLAKMALTIIVFIVGAVIAGIVKETNGVGNYLVLGVTALIILYIWKK